MQARLTPRLTPFFQTSLAQLAVCALGLLISSGLWAQGTVKGFLKSESSGEAVMFASVTLEGTNYGVSSNVDGYYSLSRIPAGQYTWWFPVWNTKL